MINRFRKTRWTRMLFAVLLTALLGLVGLTGCSFSNKDKAEEYSDISDTDSQTDGEESTDASNTEQNAFESEESTDVSNTEQDPLETEESIDGSNTEQNALEAEESTDVSNTEQGTPGDLEENQKGYFGEWVIKQVQAYGVGTYSQEDVDSLIGKSLTFTKDTASFFTDQLSDMGKVAENPTYTETVLSAGDVVTNYRIPLDNLGIEGDTVTEVVVTDANGYVSSFLIKDDNTLILIGGGTYFELLRK